MAEDIHWQVGEIQKWLEDIMELLHHQPSLREDDGEYVCSRCGLVNPGDGDPCLPINLEPAQSEGDDKAA
jgi:hypothetical protein